MEEREIVRLSQQGDEEAFSLLVKKYQAKVFSMALSFAKNREAADDLAQEIFLKAFLALPKFHFKSEFGTWLYRIAVNHSKDFLRKKGKAREISLEDIRELPLDEEDAVLAGEKERTEERRKQLVRRVLQQLPDKYKIVLTLRDIQGFSYEQISSILRLSPGTVDSRLHRARKILRKKLVPHMSQEGGLYAL